MVRDMTAAGTASLTVVSGVAVLVIGQILVRFVLNPVHALRRLIGGIAYSVDFYANVDFKDVPKSQEARQKYREQACRMRELLHQIPVYGLFVKCKVLPPKDTVEQASRLLIGLSNHDGKGDRPDLGILKLLGIKDI